MSELLRTHLPVAIDIQHAESHQHVVLTGDGRLLEAAGDEFGVVDGPAVIVVYAVHEFLEFAQSGFVLLGLQSMLELLKADHTVTVFVDLLKDLTQFEDVLFLELGCDESDSQLLELRIRAKCLEGVKVEGQRLGGALGLDPRVVQDLGGCGSFIGFDEYFTDQILQLGTYILHFGDYVSIALTVEGVLH